MDLFFGLRSQVSKLKHEGPTAIEKQCSGYIFESKLHLIFWKKNSGMPGVSKFHQILHKFARDGCIMCLFSFCRFDSLFDFWVCERILGLCLVMMSFIVKYFRISNHRMTKPLQWMVMLHIHSMPVVCFAVWLPAVWNSRTTPKVVISFIDLF